MHYVDKLNYDNTPEFLDEPPWPEEVGNGDWLKLVNAPGVVHEQWMEPAINPDQWCSTSSICQALIVAVIL